MRRVIVFVLLELIFWWIIVALLATSPCWNFCSTDGNM